ncbi:MAG: DUF1634 domain-containing protein [Vicinamibacterales bacterium]
MSDHAAALARLEHQLGRLLVTGVSLAALCLAGGLVLFVLDHASTVAVKVLNLGLIVLMATPILRVIVSMVEYVRIRDWFFVLTTIAVLAELGWTLFFAFITRA